MQTPENKSLRKNRSIEAAYYFQNGRHKEANCRAVKIKGYPIGPVYVNATDPIATTPDP